VQPGRADVAQLVEQLIRNQQVIGSSPIVGSIRHSHTAIVLPPADPGFRLSFLKCYDLQAAHNSFGMSASSAAEGYRLPAARQMLDPHSLGNLRAVVENYFLFDVIPQLVFASRFGTNFVLHPRPSTKAIASAKHLGV
jgi:hypothetical protein